MKTIQWYPGHMAKAMRMMEENVKLCDAVLYVLDARCPAASFNARLLTVTKDRPVLYLLNKSDLASRSVCLDQERLMRNAGKRVISTSGHAKSASDLKAAMEDLLREKLQRNKEKGVNKPLRFMVAGIPNTGKSTIINLLSGGKKAQTGDKAGVTRGKQWVKCGSFELLDTPGTMPPSCENQKLARRLAFVGSINDDILEMDEIALALLEELAEKYPQALQAKYDITAGQTPLEMLEQVCNKRKFMLRGGEYDFERGERALIDDFRKGKLDRMSLDSEEDMREAGLI